MKNVIINTLRKQSINIDLDSDGFYENYTEEQEINLNGLIVTLVFRIECSSNEIDLIEFIECYDSNDNYYDFSNQNIEEIESIIENNISLNGGESEDVKFYDPRENGDTL